MNRWILIAFLIAQTGALEGNCKTPISASYKVN